MLAGKKMPPPPPLLCYFPLPTRVWLRALLEEGDALVDVLRIPVDGRRRDAGEVVYVLICLVTPPSSAANDQKT